MMVWRRLMSMMVLCVRDAVLLDLNRGSPKERTCHKSSAAGLHSIQLRSTLHLQQGHCSRAACRGPCVADQQRTPQRPWTGSSQHQPERQRLQLSIWHPCRQSAKGATCSGEYGRGRMVLFFEPRGCRPGGEDWLIYMGRDKFENEDLIRYGLPNDVWCVSSKTTLQLVRLFRLCGVASDTLSSWTGHCRPYTHWDQNRKGSAASSSATLQFS